MSQAPSPTQRYSLDSWLCRAYKWSSVHMYLHQRLIKCKLIICRHMKVHKHNEGTCRFVFRHVDKNILGTRHTFFFFFYLIKAHFIASLLQLCPAEMCKSEESKGKHMFILLTESHGKTKEDFLWQVISSMNHPFYCWGRMKIWQTDEDLITDTTGNIIWRDFRFYVFIMKTSW